MKIPLAAAVLAFALPAAALSPAAQAFLRQAGLDPDSEAVRAAESDGTISTKYRGDDVAHSLESLIAEKKRNGAVAFVITRDFIRRLKADFAGTAVPRENYDALYLTKQERGLVAEKIASEVAK